MRRQRRWKNIALVGVFLTVAVVLLVWQHINRNTALYLSRPSFVAREFVQWFSSPVLRANIPISLEEAGIAFCAVMIVAIVLASLLASSKLLLAITGPYVAGWNAVPKIALAPVFILIFGTGVSGKVYFVSVAVFIVPFFSLLRALTAVDPLILNHARVLGGTRWQLVRDVYIPSVFGSMLASLRVTVQFCLLAAILSELIASSRGIGYEIEIAQAQGEPQLLVSGVLLIALMGFTLDRIVRLIERHFLVWRAAT